MLAFLIRQLQPGQAPQDSSNTILSLSFGENWLGGVVTYAPWRQNLTHLLEDVRQLLPENVFGPDYARFLFLFQTAHAMGM